MNKQWLVYEGTPGCHPAPRGCNAPADKARAGRACSPSRCCLLPAALQECTFAPRTGRPPSRQRLAPGLPVEDRLALSQAGRREALERARQEREQDALADCTFAPQVGRGSGTLRLVGVVPRALLGLRLACLAVHALCNKVLRTQTACMLGPLTAAGDAAGAAPAARVHAAAPAPGGGAEAAQRQAGAGARAAGEALASKGQVGRGKRVGCCTRAADEVQPVPACPCLHDDALLIAAHTPSLRLVLHHTSHLQGLGDADLTFQPQLNQRSLKLAAQREARELFQEPDGAGQRPRSAGGFGSATLAGRHARGHGAVG